MTEIIVAPEYTEAEASALMGLAKQTLRAYRARGTGLPYIKRGSRVFYRKSDVHEYVKGKLIIPGG